LPFVLLPIFFAGCGCIDDSATSDLKLLFNVNADGRAVTADEEPVFVEQSIFDRIPDKVGHHAGTIASLPDGELLAAWYSYLGPDELNGASIYMARRPAGQDQWSPPVQITNRPEPCGNPVLYAEGDRVWLFHAVVPLLGWSLGHIELEESADRGNTWSSPLVISDLFGSNVRYPPLRTNDGGLLLPAYDDLVRRALFFYSADGQTWFCRSALSTGHPYSCIQPSLARCHDGMILATMRNTGKGDLWVTASDDEGWSWSPPMAGGFPNPDSAAQIVRLANGHLLLLYNNDFEHRIRLTAALSADDGFSWPARRILADGAGTYSYPSATQTPDGRIHVVYSMNRQAIRHVIVNESWIVQGADAVAN